MPTVAGDLDLSWVTFSGNDRRPQCERGGSCSCCPHCPLEALWRFTWRMTCPHPAQRLLCESHRIEVLDIAGPRARLLCPHCGAEAELVSVEPLR